MTVTDDKDSAPPAPAETEAAPAETPPPARRRARWPILVTVLIAAAILAAGYYGAGYRFERAAEVRFAALRAELDAVARPAVDPAELAALANRIAVLEQRIAALEAVPAPAPALDPALTDRIDGAEAALAELARRLDAAPAPATVDPALEGRLAALEARASDDGAAFELDRLTRRLDQVAGTIAAVEPRMATFEAEIATLTGRLADAPAAALVVAVGQVRDAARGSAPFGAALDAVRGLVAGDGAALAIVDRLAPLAATGAPTLDDLRAGFDVAVTEALAPPPDPDAPWYRRTLDRLAGLVTVRRVGEEVEGDDAEARIARAERALADGDLAGALAALGDGVGPAFDGWRAGAADRLALDAALAALGDHALAVVAAAGGG